MRDIALSLFVLWVIPHLLRHTWVGVLMWTWFSLMNPHRLTWGFANNFSWAQYIALGTLASMLWTKDKLRLPADITVVAIIMFLAWLIVTTAFAIFPEASRNDLITMLKIQLMTLVAMAALHERKHIEMFIWVNVVSIGFYGVKGGLFTIASGGSSRVWGPLYSYIQGNNEIGLALVITIPLMNYLRLVTVNPWVRRGLMVMMLLSAIAVLGTQSRGAFLAIIAMSIVLWLRSRRKAIGAVVMSVLAVLFLAFMPESWEDRMRSIQDYQNDSSAQERINSWTTAVNVANDRITGAGFAIESRAIFEKYAPNPEAVFTAHSIYFQPLGEHGWIGLFLFLFIGLTCFITAAGLRRKARQRLETAWLYDLGGMVQVSMVGFAVGGAFLSLSYFDLPYNIAVILVAAKYWLREERWKTEPTGAFGSGAPTGRGALQGSRPAASPPPGVAA